MDEFRVARLLAARNVFARHNYDPAVPGSPAPDHEYLMRRIERTCCEILHSPLSEIRSLPLDELLAHYYEHQYDLLADAEGEESAEAWRQEMEALAETEEEAARRQAQKTADEAETERFARETSELNSRELKVKEGAKRQQVTLEEQARKLEELARKTGAKLGISRKYG